MALQVTPPLQEMRILLADDNRTNRKVTLAQLRTLGFFAADAVETGLDRSRAASVIYVHLRNQSGSPFGHVRQAGWQTFRIQGGIDSTTFAKRKLGISLPSTYPALAVL